MIDGDGNRQAQRRAPVWDGGDHSICGDSAHPMVSGVGDIERVSSWVDCQTRRGAQLRHARRPTVAAVLDVTSAGNRVNVALRVDPAYTVRSTVGYVEVSLRVDRQAARE